MVWFMSTRQWFLYLKKFVWQTTVILLPGVGEPVSFRSGVTSIPVDPVEKSERAPMYCKTIFLEK